MSRRIGRLTTACGPALPSAPDRSGNKSTLLPLESPAYSRRIATILEAGPAIGDLIAPHVVSIGGNDLDNAWLDAELRARHKRLTASIADVIDVERGLARRVQDPGGRTSPHDEIIKPETIMFDQPDTPPNFDTQQGDTQ